MLEIHATSYDDVISSYFATGAITYGNALTHLIPLVDRFDQQRRLQRKKFYDRLEKDILNKCIMPPITIAFVDDSHSAYGKVNDFKKYVTENLNTGYILDGLQRLSTLERAAKDSKFDGGLLLFFNVIVANKYDSLLYRMITLNNGQKPMTARHQIEILTYPMINDIRKRKKFKNMKLLTEKEIESRSPRGSIKASSVSIAYLAFMTGNVNNNSSVIIESKLDEILVGRVMEKGIQSDVSFQDILLLIDKFSLGDLFKKWIQNENNIVGFCAAARDNFGNIAQHTDEEINDAVQKFEGVLEIVDTSKINVGKFRREMIQKFFQRIEKMHDGGEFSEDLISEFILSESA